MSNAKAAVQDRVRRICLGRGAFGGADRPTLQRILRAGFEGEKTDYQCWREARCGFHIDVLACGLTVPDTHSRLTRIQFPSRIFRRSLTHAFEGHLARSHANAGCGSEGWRIGRASVRGECQLRIDKRRHQQDGDESAQRSGNHHFLLILWNEDWFRIPSEVSQLS
jgi:hypothetical protein